jgi:glucosylceramidase
MSKLQIRITTGWVAFFVAACSGSGSSGRAGDQGGAGNNVGGSPAVDSSAGGSTSDNGTAGGTTGNGGGAPSTGGSSVALANPLVITSAQGNYWKTETATTSTGAADVTVADATSSSATWEGFGGCFNEKGWGVLTSTELQTQALELLFGAEGAHFVMGRIPIGASDYADDRYTLDMTASPDDPTANGETARPPADTSMAKFSIERDTKKLIPYIQAALKINPNLRLWGSPWTPPVWMKTGYKSDSGAPGGGTAVRPSYYDGGSMKTDATTRGALAQYFVKWIQAYKSKGITVETVAPQNEPNYDQNYPSCLWDKTNYTNFVKDLASAFKTANLTTKIMLGTMSNAGGDADIVTSVMADSSAKSSVSVIGVQWGMVGNASSYVSQHKLPVWVTEHRCGNYPWDTATYKSTAPNDLAYAQESWGLIRDAIKGGVTAYNAWNMVLDNVGLGIDTSRQWAQNALLTVANGTITQTPTYYVFRHLSQYVAAGAKVVSATGSNDALAFKNPNGSFVAVVYSDSAKSNYTVSLAGKTLQFSMPANGWATVVASP